MTYKINELLISSAPRTCAEGELRISADVDQFSKPLNILRRWMSDICWRTLDEEAAIEQIDAALRATKEHLVPIFRERWENPWGLRAATSKGAYLYIQRERLGQEAQPELNDDPK